MGRPLFDRRMLGRAASRCLGSRACLSQRFFTTPLTRLTDRERTLQDLVSRFARERISPIAAQMDRDAKFPKELVSSFFEQGFMGIDIPERYGGSGLGFTSSCIVIEEIAKVDAAAAVCIDVQNTLVNNALLRFGTEEQKQFWLPRLAENTVGSFCLSEAGSGSDAFALKTKAVKSGEDYVLNGSKCWITNAGEAGLFLVLASVDLSKGYKGITAFLVDKSNPGLSLGKKEDKLGIRASSTHEVILTDCKVHESCVLGEVGKGYKIAIETLNEGRIGIGAQMIGLAQGAFDYALDYMHQRKQFGQRIADFQGMQMQYAQAACDIEAARLLVYNAARLKESHMPFVTEAAMAKLVSSQVANRVAGQCIEWLGGVGFTKEFSAEKYFRDAKIGQIYEGTSNLQLVTIAKQLSAKYS
eukprot:c19516_g1_i1.p1 GENE.c19516_g1_i1~~c19516_g1_i1.p1  ORF type:complete len:414 (-),score=93.22 c19516_g1_i1:364-1605(-)